MKTDVKTWVISGLAILFSLNMSGCSNAPDDLPFEQESIAILGGQSITVEDLQNNKKASLEQERIIKDQSFNIELNDWGDVEFVSYEPDRSVNFDDVSFCLVQDGQIIYEFPNYCEGNNTGNCFGLFDSVEAVGFRDFNNDGLDDIIVIISYVTGVGSQGMIPRPTARIFLAEEKDFRVAEDMITDISEHITEKDLTVDNVYQYILGKDTSDIQ